MPATAAATLPQIGVLVAEEARRVRVVRARLPDTGMFIQSPSDEKATSERTTVVPMRRIDATAVLRRGM